MTFYNVFTNKNVVIDSKQTTFETNTVKLKDMEYMSTLSLEAWDLIEYKMLCVYDRETHGRTNTVNYGNSFAVLK